MDISDEEARALRELMNAPALPNYIDDAVVKQRASRVIAESAVKPTLPNPVKK